MAKAALKTNMNLKKALGPLWPLYSNPDILEIIVDGVDQVYYAQKSKVIDADKIFKSTDEIKAVIKNITAFTGKKIPEGTYHYDLNIDENTRIHIALPPVSLNGPVFNIMKLPNQEISLDDLYKFKALDEKSLKILKEKCKGQHSMIVAGPAGSGKTTLLNSIVMEIPIEQRVVTIEAIPNLILSRKRCVRLVSENNTIEETKGLINAAFKMRADRLVLAYMQGPEMMNFINGVRDGYTGYACISAENVFDVVRRLEMMAMSEEPSLSLDDARYSIAQAFKLIVFQEKMPDNKRKVTNIAEIHYETGEIKLEVLYKL